MCPVMKLTDMKMTDMKLENKIYIVWKWVALQCRVSSNIMILVAQRIFNLPFTPSPTTSPYPPPPQVLALSWRFWHIHQSLFCTFAFPGRRPEPERFFKIRSRGLSPYWEHPLTYCIRCVFLGGAEPFLVGLRSSLAPPFFLKWSSACKASCMTALTIFIHVSFTS